MKKHERSPGGERLVCQLKLRRERDGERRGNGLEINHNEEVEGCGKKEGRFSVATLLCQRPRQKKLEIKECPDAAALKPDRTGGEMAARRHLLVIFD